MTNLELIFSMLGEEQTKLETIKKDAQGFIENKDAAIKGGSAAGKALNAFEQETGNEVISDQNFKQQVREAKKKRILKLKKKDDKAE